MSRWSSAIYYRPNGRYYKYKASADRPGILEAGTAEALEKNSREFHDHYFKVDGVWYVQSSVNAEHLFTDLKPGVQGVEQAEAGEYLDALLRELQQSG